ncbi:uncharacterized protein EDB93DRAFT_597208 [Suillus bovinus]|uniref:uncharacterized protein n=1 Tax=Suillus bovinus TaxID=48563 RepID=UPI001B87FAAF|nr:uncharacterized protein EDB93DRAFT_597208 [Suillus bovinus]KAG2142872.1 hypothetical protein EDB93DRAFT_597208 [Suillus bovinus]
MAQDKPQVNDKVPEMIWVHQVEDTSTAKLRKGLDIDDLVRCPRILNIHVSWKFQPITNLSGKDFERVWWIVIIYHRILWINGIHQYDVSPSNLMVYQTLNGLMMGVVIDCDLSLPENESGGHQRIGMVPFMAIDLITKKPIESKDKTEPLYSHITESFFWVFVWVRVQYEDGKLSKERPLDCWLIGDAFSCKKVKSNLLKLSMENRISAPSPPQPCWELDQFVLTLIASCYVADRDPMMERPCIFRRWFSTQLPSSIGSVIHSPKSTCS